MIGCIGHDGDCCEEREQDLKDAERYRWLRRQPDDTKAPRIDVVLWTEGDMSCNDGTGLRMEKMDETIDKAMMGANAKLTGAEPVGGASELSEGLGNGGSDGQ